VVEAAGVADEPRDMIRVTATAESSRSTGDREPCLRTATGQIQSVSSSHLGAETRGYGSAGGTANVNAMRGTVLEPEMAAMGGLEMVRFWLAGAD